MANLFFKPKLQAVYALALFALGCSTPAPRAYDLIKAPKINTVMESWVGHYQSDLIASWGPPTKIVPNDTGGSTIIYESLKGIWGHEKDKHIIVGGAQYPADPKQPGYAATRIFHVNEKGIIYAWEWSGL